MTKSAFQSATNKWLICLIAVALAPLLMFAVLTVAGQCRNGGGQCFGVALLFLFWVGPIGAVTFALLLLWSIGRRIKSLHMGVMWTLAVTVWLFALAPQAALAVGLGGFSILAMFGRGTSLSNVAEFLFFLPRTPFPFLLAFVVFLRRAEPGDIHIADHRRRAAMIAATAGAGYVTILSPKHWGRSAAYLSSTSARRCVRLLQWRRSFTPSQRLVLPIGFSHSSIGLLSPYSAPPSPI